MVRNNGSEVNEKNLRNVIASFGIDSFQVPLDVILEAQSYLEGKEKEKQERSNVKEKRLVIRNDFGRGNRSVE